MYLNKPSPGSGRPPLRVLLVDDSWAFLGSAEHFLSMEPDLQIIGCVSSGQEAIEQVPLLRPDLVLMDIAMPHMSGLTAARHIKALPDGPRLVLLTVHDFAAYRAEAEAVGADGFLGKADFGTHLVPLIHRLFGEPTPEANPSAPPALRADPPDTRSALSREHRPSADLRAPVASRYSASIAKMDTSSRNGVAPFH